jgi:rod shape-determining protein MreD
MTGKSLERTVLVALTALCLVLETRVELMGVRPSLIVLPVYYVGLRHSPLRGCLVGALIGAISDSLAGHLLGPNMLAMGTVGIMASMLTGGFLRWTPLLGVIALFVITFLQGIISYGALAAFAEPPATMYIAATALLVQGAINAIAGVFIKPADEH